jgi:hypothetical protein
VVSPVSASVTVAHQHPVAASSLFTAHDALGMPIVQYDFWDNGSDGGTWLLNGVPLGLNQDNFVPASQLSLVTYRGGAGTETIWERASDGIGFGAWVSLSATDTAPVVTPSSANVNVGHAMVAASSLFTAGDADTDNIVQYEFFDSGQAGGHWVLNGIVQPDNQTISISASQLAQMTYRGGSGTETIWERASDGVQFGAWVSLNATGTESAPAVAPTSASVVASYKSSVAATTLFTVYDRDGDLITQYDFWDNGAGGGHWSINGVAQGSNVEIIVNASQLSQVTYTPGAGTDTLFVRANDGLLWSAWTAGFSATDVAPVSTPVHNSVSGAGNRTYAFSNLFAVSDADGDQAAVYDFWDNGAGGGHWSINGVAQGSNHEILVNASQLSQVTYQSGSGTDTLFLRASDGLHFGAWTQGVSVANAPVANPNQSAFTLSHTQSVAATTLFTATDADGDPITKYDFWDNGMGGGHWSINGVAQGSNVEIIVNASQLSQVTYTPGAGTDTLFVRVNDGTQWSAWTPGFTAVERGTRKHLVHQLAGRQYRPDLCGLRPVHHHRCGHRCDRQIRFLGQRRGRRPLVGERRGEGKQSGDRGECFPALAGDLHRGGGYRHAVRAHQRRPPMGPVDARVPRVGRPAAELCDRPRRWWGGDWHGGFAHRCELRLQHRHAHARRFPTLRRDRSGPGRPGLARSRRHQFHQRHDDRDLDECHERRRHVARDRRHASSQHRAPRQLHGVDVRLGERRPRRHDDRRSADSRRSAAAGRPTACVSFAICFIAQESRVLASGPLDEG